MDNSKWTYKKWSDILTIINGRDYKSVVDANGTYPIYGSGGIIGYANSYLCPANTVIIGRKGNINKPIFMNQKFWNVDTAFGLVANKEALNPKYLYYFCVRYDFEKHNKAVTIPSLTKKDLLNIGMVLPPLTSQQHIVSELEQLSELISLKQQQLKEYDTLEQSLFYEMFGDIKGKEKGYPTSTFGECFKLKSGTGLTAKDFIKGAYPVYGGNGIAGYHNEYNLEGTHIVIGRVGALCGNVHLVNGKIFATDNAFILTDNKGFDTVYLRQLLSMLNLRSYAREAMQPVISNKTLKDITIPLPPLFIQHSFASKFRAIEDQKFLVKQSIAETQTLLDSRMQDYFG